MEVVFAVQGLAPNCDGGYRQVLTVHGHGKGWEPQCDYCGLVAKGIRDARYLPRMDESLEALFTLITASWPGLPRHLVTTNEQNELRFVECTSNILTINEHHTQGRAIPAHVSLLG